MGMWSSSSDARGDANNDLEELHRTRMEERLRESGVLLPPLFGIVGDFPPSVEDAQTSEFYPCLYKTFRRMDPCYRILHDHMLPGLWFKTPASSNNGTVLASLTTRLSEMPTTTTTATDPNSDNNNNNAVGRILGAWKPTDRIVAQIRGGTEGATSLTTRVEVLPGLALWAAGNTQGDGWLSSNLHYSYTPTSTSPKDNDDEYSRNDDPNSNKNTRSPPLASDVHLELVSWLPFTTRGKKNAQHFHAFGALHVAGMTAAAETKVSLDGLELSETKSYWSMDVTGGPQQQHQQAAGPPLQISLERTSPTLSALSLSQVLTFDRMQFNPNEDRAPNIRNTAAWTVRLEKTTSTDNPDVSLTDISVGAAWQVNRAVAVKAVVRPMQNHVTGALILKRWMQPRITCSLLGRHNWHTGQTSFLGLGLEVETGVNAADYAGSPSSVGRDGVPETKVQPGDNQL